MSCRVKVSRFQLLAGTVGDNAKDRDFSIADF